MKFKLLLLAPKGSCLIVREWTWHWQDAREHCTSLVTWIPSQ